MKVIKLLVFVVFLCFLTGIVMINTFEYMAVYGVDENCSSLKGIYEQECKDTYKGNCFEIKPAIEKCKTKTFNEIMLED